MERRIICGRVGYGKFVKDLALVDEENGSFEYIPQSDMQEFTNDPMTGAILLRYFCIEIFKKLDIEHCKRVVANPGLIKDSTFIEDTQWLVREMCG